MNRKKWINLSLKILFLLAIAPPTFGKISQNEQFLDNYFRASLVTLSIYPIFSPWPTYWDLLHYLYLKQD